VYGPDRLRHPALRTGPKGSGRFKRISWDEAFQLIVDRFDTDEAGVPAYGLEDACSLLGLPPHEKYATTMEKVVKATRAYLPSASTRAQLEQQRLLLERARLERAIRRAREEGGLKIRDLAREREQVLDEIRAIDARMERAI